jgi:K+-sensing histidine kinase KdpD
MTEKRMVRSKADTKKKEPQEQVARLRALAHDLSNSLEAIMQASYLLSQARLDGESKRWAQLLQKSSDEAAKINRELRRVLRSLSDEP